MLNLTEVYVSRTLQKLRVYIWIAVLVTPWHVHAYRPDIQDNVWSNVLQARSLFSSSYPGFLLKLFLHFTFPCLLMLAKTVAGHLVSSVDEGQEATAAFSASLLPSGSIIL